MKNLPTPKQALLLLEKSGCSKNVVNHTKTVARLAVEIARCLQRKGLKVDLELVEVGALLHDIGRAKTHSVHHATVGAEIAESYGLPDPVIAIIERHVGGGIAREEAKELGWKPKDYLPETLEEKIVCYTDKLIEGVRRTPVEVAVRKLARKLGDDHPSLERVRKLHEEFVFMLGDAYGACDAS